MFTRRPVDRYTTLVVAGLVMAATVMISALGFAVAGMQIVA